MRALGPAAGLIVGGDGAGVRDPSRPRIGSSDHRTGLQLLAAAGGEGLHEEFEPPLLEEAGLGAFEAATRREQAPSGGHHARLFEFFVVAGPTVADAIARLERHEIPSFANRGGARHARAAAGVAPVAAEQALAMPGPGDDRARDVDDVGDATVLLTLPRAQESQVEVRVMCCARVCLVAAWLCDVMYAWDGGGMERATTARCADGGRFLLPERRPGLRR